MSDRPVTDIAAARQRRSRRKPNAALAEFALSQCEEAFHQRDWEQFDYWLRLYRGVRSRPNWSPTTPSVRSLTMPAVANSDGATTGRRRFTKASKTMWHFSRIAAALLLLTTAVPAPAQTLSYSTSPKATVVASTSLSNVGNNPRFIRLIGGRLSTDEIRGTSSADGFLYQIAGTAEISVEGERRTLATGDALFIPAGAQVTMKGGAQPSAYLQFLLTPMEYFALPDFSAVDAREIFRSSTPIAISDRTHYRLDLSRVTLPYQAPPDQPHRRTGAAFHLVLSGFGAETANGTTVAKGPGSMSFEPAGLTYQWSNPGNLPLTYLVFNLNPENESAVLAAAAQNGPRQ